MLTYYSAPFDLISKIIIFPASITPALFPYFSYHGSRGGTVVSDTTSRSLKYLLLVMTPGIAVFFFFANDILRLWLGPQFAAQSTGVMQIIAVVFFLNAFAMVPFTSVQALGRPDLKAILDMIALPTYALACWFLLKHMGLNGAALAKLFITVVDCTFLFGFAHKLKAFSLRDCVSGSLGRTFLLSGGLFVTVFWAHLIHAKVLLSLVILMICFAVYALLFWFLAMDANEKSTILELAQQWFSGKGRRETAAAMAVSETDAGA
jgi:O-antigen/teichoic acid export membrane protein